MGAAIALRRFVPVQIIGSRMRIVFILLAAVVFEAAISAVTEFDEFVPSESVPVNHGSEEELDQVIAPSRIKGLPNWQRQNQKMPRRKRRNLSLNLLNLLLRRM